MKVAVRYYSKSGNTEKLAKTIAGAIGVKAENISVGLDEDIDILFLGSSVYAAGVDDTVKNFINSIDVKIGSVVNFSTAAIIQSTYKQIKKLVELKGINMSDQEFHCKGSFGIIHKDRPNASDFKGITEFAKKVIK